MPIITWRASPRTSKIVFPVSRKTLNRAIGDRGEEAAAQLLLRRGFRILERNYRCAGGEIDIIAEDCGTIAFVEVKTRSPRSYFAPADAVDSEKQRRIRAAASIYLAVWREPSPRRYDIVSVLLDDADCIVSVELQMNAFSDE